MENKIIICKGVNDNLKILICKNEFIAEKKGYFWYTDDDMSEVGEDVVIENTSGARVSAKRIK